MTEFIPLEEFLLLPNMICKNEYREFYKHKTGTQWYYWYQLAKASFNQFGETGPPIGSTVLTLISGHGGSGGNKRKFCGQYISGNKDFDNNVNKNFFKIQDNNGYESLVYKDYWWREIVAIDPEPIGWGGFPKGKFYKRQHYTELEAIVEYIIGT